MEMGRFSFPKGRGRLSSAAIAAALGLTLGVICLPDSPAWAETHEDGTVTDGGHTGGSHTDGHDEGDHEDGHESGGPRGPGGGGKQEGGHEGGGHSDTGEGGKGPQAGGGGQAGRGQDADRPVWAQEGIPEVELGRLNVARAPDQVFERAFSEAQASFTPKVAAFYRLDLDEMATMLRESWDTVQLIDSPLQNLALMKDALSGTSILSTVGIETDNDTLIATFLGTASDKSIPVTADTVTAVTAILGRPVSAARAAELAEMAETIRLAIVAGHG